ncbi:MAG: heme ABC transporter ATP-binding protein [Rhodosalinus sp.]
MLDARDLTVHLGKRCILQDLAFRAVPGEVTVILGPNGSGKTTLMRALTGEIPAEGRITLDGTDPRSLRPWQLAQRRGVLAQFARLAFPFTVLEVVRLGAEAAGEAGTAASHRARAALARVDLSGYEARFYQELSGGEQARVQLARVLAQVWEPRDGDGPRWLFLDEPVASLDVAHQLQVMELAGDYARRGGGVVAVMHDLTLTALFADHVVLLDQGRVAASGPPRQVMDPERLAQVYGCRIDTIHAEAPDRLIVTPVPRAAPLQDPAAPSRATGSARPA